MADIAARVEQRLASSVLRRLEGNRAIEKHPHTVWFNRCSWGRDLALAIGAAGVTHPALSFVTGQPDGVALAGWVGTVPFGTGLAGIVLLVPLMLPRLYVQHERLADVVPLSMSCKWELGDVEGRLDEALGKGDPLAAIAPNIDEATRS